MKLLLDTHVWIWSQELPEKLGRRSSKLLIAADNENWVCSISTLEVARLVATGAVVLSMPLGDWVEQSLVELGAQSIPVTNDVALEAYSLPGRFHRDPADRLLVAAARCHGATLVTADERILAYRDVRTIDARR